MADSQECIARSAYQSILLGIIEGVYKGDQLLNRLRYLLLVTKGDEIEKLWLGNARYPAVKIGVLIENTRLADPRIKRRVVMLRTWRKYRTQSRGDISVPVAALPLELGMIQITNVGGARSLASRPGITGKALYANTTIARISRIGTFKALESSPDDSKRYPRLKERGRPEFSIGSAEPEPAKGAFETNRNFGEILWNEVRSMGQNCPIYTD